MLDKSGSCAIVALLVEKRVYIVNVGDSRAIMSYDGGNFSCNLSLDHKSVFYQTVAVFIRRKI